MILDRQYTRRCKECGRPTGRETSSRYELPGLDKKVIYLDQLVISNIVKVLDPEAKKARNDSLDSFWITLFEQLDRLCKMQLIICPHSQSHTYESLLSRDFANHKKLYELLSYNTSFIDFPTIRRFQIHQQATNWAAGYPELPIVPERERAFHSKLNVWQGHSFISFPQSYLQESKNEVRSGLMRTAESLERVFRRWQTERNRPFQDWFQEESMSYGKSIMKMYRQGLDRLARALHKGGMPSLDELLGPEAADMVLTVQMALERSGVEREDISRQVSRYLLSTHLADLPFNRISSLMWAAVARKAAAGQKRPPSRGMHADIETVSCLMPYCDAMFVDKECKALLTEKPVCDRIGYTTRLFSLSKKAGFLEYLMEIEAGASRKHIAALKEVYGEDYGKPYTDLFK